MHIAFWLNLYMLGQFPAGDGSCLHVVGSGSCSEDVELTVLLDTFLSNLDYTV